MQVGELLSALMEQGDKSKNAIIREAHIDRSSFYKILSGERKATPEQLVSILRVIGPDEAARSRILDAYELEQAGEALYRQREEVRRFLNGLSAGMETAPDVAGELRRTGEMAPGMAEESCRCDETAPDAAGELRQPGGMVPAIPEELRRFVAQESQTGTMQYSAFLPVGSTCMTGLFTLLSAGASEGRTCPGIRALVANEESLDESILQAFAGWFRYLSRQTLRFHAYTLWSTTRGLEALPYPYYILGSHSILLISGDETRFALIEDARIVEAYRANYEVQIGRGREIANTETDYEPILRFFMGLWQGALESREQIYLLSPRPCMYLCSTDEMVRKYMHEENYVQYGRMLRNLNMQEFTTRTGMQRFLDELMLCEAGFQIPVEPADMEDAHQRILRNTSIRTFFLNEERVHLPQEWQMFIIAHRMAVFVPFQTSSYIMCVTSGAVVEPLTEWCMSRVSCLNHDVERDDEA